MATGDRVQIADKPTLDAVRNNIGNTNDTGGTSTTGTTQAKLNAALVKTDGVVQSLNQLDLRLSGINSPYGNGVYGNMVYDPTSFSWPTQDSFNRYVLQFDSLIIPAGVTMRPPEKCDGLYILCKGNVTINGTVDVTDLRKSIGNTQISSQIKVDDKLYTLANGGYAPKGGACGSGGQTKWRDSPYDQESSASFSYTNIQGADGVTPESSGAGSVIGGGIGQVAFPAKPPELALVSHWNSSDDLICNISVYKEYSAAYNGYSYGIVAAPTAVVLIVGGVVTINSTGVITAEGSGGMDAEDGNPPEETYISSARHKRWQSGRGGYGAISPSGGGPVTIICKTFNNSGIINTSGNKLISPNGNNDTTISPVINNGARFYGGEGGEGGTFISTPGEIKIYETGGNS